MENAETPIRRLNPHIRIHSVRAAEFAKYGKLVEGFDFTEWLEWMQRTPIPEEGNVYVASDPELERSELTELVQSSVFGGMPVQVGYCNGRNSSLNGLEYHKSSEVNIAVTDLVLLLGHVADIRDTKYRSGQVEAFFIPRGTAIEMYATTLHFGPCKAADEGFRCIVVLPRGTNEPLPGPIKRVTPEDDLLFMRNKWLLAHPERKALIDRGAYPGILGENIRIIHAEEGGDRHER
jgi:hypothetical protein